MSTKSKYSKFKFTKPNFNYEQKLYDNNDSLNEADGDNESGESVRGEDQLRIEACKLSQKISKLMDNVSPADMLEIADACLKYIKYQKAGEEYDPTFGLEDAANETTETKSEESTEKNDNEETSNETEDTSENGALSFDDLDFSDDDFEIDDKKEDTKEDDIPDDFIV